MEVFHLSAKDEVEIFWFNQGAAVAKGASSPAEVLNEPQFIFSEMSADKKRCFISGAIYHIIESYFESLGSHKKRMFRTGLGKSAKTEEAEYLNLLGFADYILSDIELFILDFDKNHDEGNNLMHENNYNFNLIDETNVFDVCKERVYEQISKKIYFSKKHISEIIDVLHREYTGSNHEDESVNVTGLKTAKRNAFNERRLNTLKRISCKAPAAEEAESAKIDGVSSDTKFPYATIFIDKCMSEYRTEAK